MDESLVISGNGDGQRLAAALVRQVRHEVGDLLQSVLSAVALLEKSLPGQAPAERGILESLRNRASNCKQFVDAVHDLVNPIKLNLATVSLASVATTVAGQAGARYPHLQIHVEAEEVPPIIADRYQLVLVGKFLLEQACAAARQHVWFRTGTKSAGGECEWVVSDDGMPVAADAEDKIFSPNWTGRPGYAGVWLAYIQKVVIQHGGRVSAGRAPEGGLCLRVVLPPSPPTIGEQVLSAHQETRS